MAAPKKMLVLGNSTGGGEWPPLAAVALGLFQRGHSVRYVADSTSAAALRHTGLVLDVVRPEAELMPYFIRWGERVAAAGPSAEGNFPVTAPLTEWAADCFPMVCELVSQFKPDFILSQLFALELASRIKTKTGLPWGFVNPGCYFGPDSVRPLEADVTSRTYPAFVHFRSLLGSADLVLHGTDAVFDPPPARCLRTTTMWGCCSGSPP